MTEHPGSKGSKSSQIRAEFHAGRSVSRIAEIVGVPYHHAYSVLHQSGLVGKAARGRGVDAGRCERSAESVEWLRLRLDESGRVQIPQSTLRTLGASGPTELIARLVDGELRIVTPKTAVERAQKLVRELIPGSESLADSLIADRRKGAANGD